MKTISFASKLLLYIDELNTTKNHETLFKVTGYVERPDYEHYSKPQVMYLDQITNFRKYRYFS